MGLAFKCDNLTCGKILIAGKDLIFNVIRKDENSKQDMCLECIVLMKENNKKDGSWFDVNKISLFDYPEYRSNN